MAIVPGGPGTFEGSLSKASRPREVGAAVEELAEETRVRRRWVGDKLKSWILANAALRRWQAVVGERMVSVRSGQKCRRLPKPGGNPAETRCDIRLGKWRVTRGGSELPYVD